MKISIIIPVYQNQGSIVLTYQNILSVLKDINVGSYEFIFVNDGSTDNSAVEIRQLEQKDSNVKSVFFTRNFGQVPAMIAGFKIATGDVAVNISADLQDPPGLIKSMLEAWKAGFKIVVCYRENRDDGFINNITSNLFYSIINTLNPSIPKGGFDFCLLDKEPLFYFNQIDERNRFFQGDIMWLGYKVKLIPYERLKRKIGKSKWTLSKKIKYLIDGIITTTYLPIRIISFLGLIVSFSGFLYAIIIIINWKLNNTPFNGWAPIMVAILLIGGIIMLILGIIGEYIWRIYDEVRRRSVFLESRIQATENE